MPLVPVPLTVIYSSYCFTVLYVFYFFGIIMAYNYMLCDFKLDHINVLLFIEMSRYPYVDTMGQDTLTLIQWGQDTLTLIQWSQDTFTLIQWGRLC